MAETLTKLERWLDHKGPWLLENQYSLADIAIVPFVDGINALLPELLAETAYPRTFARFTPIQNCAVFVPALHFADGRARQRCR